MESPPPETYNDDSQYASTEAFTPKTVAALDEKYGREPGNEDILRIVPSDHRAQVAFHELALKNNEGILHEHHAQFIVIRERKLASSSHGYDPEPSDSANASSSSEAEEPIFEGYFHVNFDCRPLTKGVKYVIGKGSSKSGLTRNVDIMLAAPDSKYRRPLAAAHIFLGLHRESGAWTISAGGSCHDERSDLSTSNGSKDCSHSPIIYNGNPLRHGAIRCLQQPRSSLVVGGMHFDLQFQIDTTTKERHYLEDRNIWLTARDVDIPATSISGIPFESDIKNTWAVFRKGLAFGTSGVVFEGIEPQTGDLRAIKTLQIRTDSQRNEVEQELTVTEALSEEPGIVKSYGWCDLNGEGNFGFGLPSQIFLVQEKGVPLHSVPWTEALYKNWTIRRVICKYLLTGLSAIHRRGWMHRDITPNNVLVFTKPVRAVLCDFGRLCKRKTSTNTAIAAWDWLPPEIQKSKNYVYNQSVDIWELGLTLLRTWFPWVRSLDLRKSEDHVEVLSFLNKAASRDRKALRMNYGQRGIDEMLADPGACAMSTLISSMISEKPENRPSVTEALNNMCLTDLDLSNAPEIDHLCNWKQPR